MRVGWVVIVDYKEHPFEKPELTSLRDLAADLVQRLATRLRGRLMRTKSRRTGVRKRIQIRQQLVGALSGRWDNRL